MGRGKNRFLKQTRTAKLHAALFFGLPAICDSGATTLLNVGLFYTFASVFQMLRGTLVIFAGLLTIIVLKRQLHVHHWFGIVLITAGAALVGASRCCLSAVTVAVPCRYAPLAHHSGPTCCNQTVDVALRDLCRTTCLYGMCRFNGQKASCVS